MPLSKCYYPQTHRSKNKPARRAQRLSSHSDGDTLTPHTNMTQPEAVARLSPPSRKPRVTVWGGVRKTLTQDRAQLWACFGSQQ